MLIPLPTQLSGAKFLAERSAALLADSPRVGKTGAAILAADYIFARTILVVTTASGRSVWQRAFPQWSTYNRSLQVLTPKTPIRPDTEIAIVGWADIANPTLRAKLLTRTWSVLILDESHYAKSLDAKRTQAALGEMIEDGTRVLVNTSLAHKADGVWCLSGTPAPNSLLDLYPMLRVLASDRLRATGDFPDVTTFSAFKKRYCITKPVKIGHGYMARYVDVVIGGRNEAELKARLDGFILLRTQEDVGIRPPVYETFPLIVSDANRRATETGVDSAAILKAAEADDTKSLEMHLGPLRRLTGEINARAVVEAVKEEFECGLDKIVLAYWHKDVRDILAEGLKDFGVVGIDGSSSPDARLRAELDFRDNPKARVFLGQIEAAGEAVDLSPAAELIFVETVFQPKSMKQMSLRITNHGQRRQPRVRVAVLAGSINETLQEILLRKWAPIRKVLTQ
jgi:SWI/SNF-related matrix-associated actin-dependent regulator 1 of chromatin subfamily A